MGAAGNPARASTRGASKRTVSRACGCRRSMSPTCLRDDTRVRRVARLHPTCLWEVSSRQRGSSPDLSSGSVFTHQCVFAMTRSSPDLSSGSVFASARVFARPVFGKCLHHSSPTPASSRRRGPSPDLPSNGKCLRPPTSCFRDDACRCLRPPNVSLR